MLHLLSKVQFPSSQQSLHGVLQAIFFFFGEGMKNHVASHALAILKTTLLLQHKVRACKYQNCVSYVNKMLGRKISQ